MIDLSHRHHTKELMDRDDIPFADMAVTLKELDIINTRLGGHSITLSGLKQLAQGKKSITVCEIGCGGGDNLRVIHRWCVKNNIAVKLVGIDINQECIRFAEKRNASLPATWICSDYATAALPAVPDLIFSSLFCHHFTDEQLVFMMKWMSDNSTAGFFINDLHRHPMAFYLIKYITKFFSRSYLVRNDACISVSRGFSRHDLEQYFKNAGLSQPHISWRWAFRWLVIYKHRP
ncbi:MAG: methyltransferase domain-containing protein [Chitinophagaceae bacterium]|nr:MAG: methyltransferase domain-containing protein [Chitinophagaceae bacterium]